MNIPRAFLSLTSLAALLGCAGTTNETDARNSQSDTARQDREAFEEYAAYEAYEREEERHEMEGASVGGKKGLRAQYRTLALLDENRQIPHDAMMRAKAEVAALPLSSSTGAGLDSTKWTSIGPGVGRVRALAIHPNDSKVLFAGSASGGIWRSDDFGVNWRPLDDHMGNLAITAIQIQANDPRVMYASTGEGFAQNQLSTFGTGVRGAGIFKSLDGGTSWNRIPATNSTSFYYTNEIALTPDGSILLAATDDGIYRSIDGGNTYTKTYTGGRSRDVNFHPTDKSIAVAHFNSNGGTQALYSVDGGASWKVASGLGDNFVRRIEFAWHSGWTGGGNGCVYAQMDVSGTVALYRSTDGGASFVEIKRGHVFPSQVSYNNTLWIAPTPRDSNPANDVIIAGTVNMARSFDGGANFAELQHTSLSTAYLDFHVVLNDPGYNGASNKRAYICSDGGVYSCQDILASQVTCANLNATLHIQQHYAGSRQPTSGLTYVGSQDIGCSLRDDTKARWEGTAFGDGSYSACDPVNTSYIYGSTQFAAVNRSINGKLEYINGVARSYPPTNEKKPGYIITDSKNRQSQFIAPMVMDPNDPNRLLVGTVQLWRTNDARTPNDEVLLTGPAWTPIKPPLATNAPISAIDVQVGNSNVVWVGHSFEGVYSTTNALSANPTWTRRGQASLPIRHISRILIDPSNANRIFVVYGGFTSNNVWRSTDGGNTFSPISSFPSVPVRDIKVHSKKSGWLYAATEVGLLVSEDDGATWTGSVTPADVSIFELEWSNDDLYLFTHGRGVFHQKVVEGANLPDLEVLSISPADSRTTWDAAARYTVMVTVINNGTVAAPANLSAIVWSRDTNAEVADDVLDTFSTPALGPGARQTFPVSFGTPYCLTGPGNFHIGAVVDANNAITESVETNNGRVLTPARPVNIYAGNGRYLDYLDPRTANRDGPAWRGYAEWFAKNGMNAQICVTAPSHKGHFVVLLMSGSNSGVVLDALTDISLSVPFFPPVVVQTSTSTGTAIVQQVMPPFTLNFNVNAYIYSAWFTPQFVFNGFGDNFVSNVIKK
ncbi:MAG: hypothetical protein KDC95_05105 [Planctomycetes bacterium]|nr:hypothetical protein [Planctomycetota bacterium]